MARRALASRKEATFQSEDPLKQFSGLMHATTQPGILILNFTGQILYVNEEAIKLLEKLKPKNQKTGMPAGLQLPPIVSDMSIQVRRMMKLDKEISPRLTGQVSIVDEIVYLFRPILLNPKGSSQFATHLLILIEKISHGPYLDHVVQMMVLTPREQAVTQFLIEGKTNKEVAVNMGLSEFTVKDHIKKIMRKLKVNTRAGVVAKILKQT